MVWVGMMGWDWGIERVSDVWSWEGIWFWDWFGWYLGLIIFVNNCSIQYLYPKLKILENSNEVNTLSHFNNLLLKTEFNIFQSNHFYPKSNKLLHKFEKSN